MYSNVQLELFRICFNKLALQPPAQQMCTSQGSDSNMARPRYDVAAFLHLVGSTSN